ncbi:glycosyltransferase family 4 protein [Erwiniaceae bacterium BAC15a-03b]|uniref:Glycosyltransferase family 4 protein n=1 Tax=Winslowiella arboricola TaxID=2978220 RepID=A0A9J6PT20_9GAMM|nr:glycosyltransferase family 4 protein [Winslowiella arboricola]MCU5774274.1 glycosyltransferase family 4 protein [Winslowiella arboricola]MCU5778821.1 glycosyltransferase family 4 protein [Winslowiella arboricola]
MKQMKVLHINDKYEGGGAESVFRDTIKATEELGYESRMLCSDGKTNPLSYLFSSKYYRETLKLITAFSPDIVHLHNYYHYLTPSVLKALRDAKKKHKFKVVLTAHDYHLICPNSGFQHFTAGKRTNFNPQRKNLSYLQRFDHRSVVHSLLKCTQHLINYRLLKLSGVFDLIISPGEFLSRVFSAWGVKQPVTVVRNPVEFLPSEPVEQETLVVNQNRAKELVFIGRLSVEKGLLEFVGLLNKQSHGDINLNIYGQGEAEQALKATSLRPGLKLIFHGFKPREEVTGHLAQYDVFVLPSVWYENAPISIVEAANAGLPVLVPNYGGLQEMAELTQQAVLFDYNQNDLNDKLELAFAKRKTNALKDKTIFTFEAYKSSLEKIYTQLVNNK